MIRMFAASAVLLATTTGFAHATDLVFDVNGIDGSEGKIMVALHTPKDGVTFPDEAGAVAAQWRAAAPGSLRFVFADLAPGRYALAVFHDRNGDGVLDTNLLGMPTEGYGFSNDAKGFAGPPGFDAAAVEVSGPTSTDTSTTLTY